MRGRGRRFGWLFDLAEFAKLFFLFFFFFLKGFRLESLGISGLGDLRFSWIYKGVRGLRLLGATVVFDLEQFATFFSFLVGLGL
jgi:hypothetical protein